MPRTRWTDRFCVADLVRHASRGRLSTGNLAIAVDEKTLRSRRAGFARKSRHPKVAKSNEYRFRHGFQWLG
jgi:hypothetical protein